MENMYVNLGFETKRYIDAEKSKNAREKLLLAYDSMALNEAFDGDDFAELTGRSNDRPSLCVAVQNFAPAHGSAKATPRSLKRSRSAIADEENPATEPGFGDSARDSGGEARENCRRTMTIRVDDKLCSPFSCFPFFLDVPRFFMFS